MPEGEKRICFLQGIREDPTKKILVLSIKGENIWPGISRIKMFLFKKTKKNTHKENGSQSQEAWNFKQSITNVVLMHQLVKDTEEIKIKL